VKKINICFFNFTLYIFFLFIFFPANAFASWIILPEGYETNIDSFPITLNSITPQTYPFIHSVIDDDTTILNLDVSITGNLSYGAGFGISNKLPTYGQTQDLAPDDYIFLVWPTSPEKVSIFTSLCSEVSVNCIHGKSVYKIYSSGTSSMKAKIVYDNERYSVFINDELIFLSHATDFIWKHSWLGQPQKTTTTQIWPTVSLNNYLIDSVIQTKSPVVIIPGMGASVDYEALLSGNDGTNWHVPEYVNAYDNLINSLTDQGYEIDKDLHVFAYDWRKPILDNADKLSAYLLSLGIDSENKAQFVSHSMGGLVARSYLEKYGNGNISKLITVGTPRQGSTDAYPLWQAGKTFDNIWWANAVLSVASLTDRNWSDKPIETLRKNIPSIAQILPTFDHISMNNSLVPVDSMKHKNTFLPKPPIPDGLDNMIDVIYGTDIETKQVIKTEVRTRIDRMWGVWDDGKPIKKNPFVYGQGDGTVLAMSAVSNANNLFELSLDHTDLIWNEVGVTKILERLGLEINPSLVLDTPDNNSEFVSVALRSPGRLSVCKENICDDDLGYMSDDKKVALLPTGAGNYQIVVTSTGDSGDYGLSVDSGLDLLDRAIIHGHLTSGKQDVYEAVVSESGDVSILPDTDTLHDSIRRVWDQIRVIEKNFDKKLAVTKSLSATTKDRYRLTQLSRLELIYLLSRSYKYGTDETTRLGLELWRLLDMDDESFWQDKSVSYPKYKHDLMYKVRSRLSDLILKTGKFSDDNILLAHAISESHDLLSDLDDLDPKTQTGLYKAKINSVDSWLLLSLKVRHVK
jgi:pimeloyl-ACP methyl ester carboxylesterase